MIAVLSFSTVGSSFLNQPSKLTHSCTSTVYPSISALNSTSFLGCALTRPFYCRQTGLYNPSLLHRCTPAIVYLRWPPPYPQLCVYRHRQLVCRMVHEAHGEVLVVGGALWVGARGRERLAELMVGDYRNRRCRMSRSQREKNRTNKTPEWVLYITLIPNVCAPMPMSISPFCWTTPQPFY